MSAPGGGTGGGPSVPPGLPGDRFAYPPAYYAPGWQPPAQRWDAVSIAALVTGAVGLGPVPVALGVAGLRRTRRDGTRGRGLAWAGLALGLVSLLAYAALSGLVWLLLRSLPPDVAAPRFALASQVSAGNCLARLPDDGEVWAVRVVPCEDPHRAQVLAAGALVDPPDGQRRLDEAAEQLCRETAPAVGGRLVVWAPVPGRGAVTCLVEVDDDWTGSMLDGSAATG